ncbi:DUF397 domain-containing protein [Streptomyces sp. NPDC058256]|uniref:DUF397 domain-containing protein n=1 Tax=Streptomyces sp. NPDC058256 TaxID=3346408 RepID=UPI0036E3C027
MTEHNIPNASTLSSWRKSSYSGSDQGSCVEVLDGYPPGVPVRDSKIPDAQVLLFPPTSWSSFVAAVKDGEFTA